MCKKGEMKGNGRMGIMERRNGFADVSIKIIFDLLAKIIWNGKKIKLGALRRFGNWRMEL